VGFGARSFAVKTSLRLLTVLEQPAKDGDVFTQLRISAVISSLIWLHETLNVTVTVTESRI